MTEPEQGNHAAGEKPAQPHGCATLFLVWIIIANVIAALVIPFMPEWAIRQSLPGYEPWMAVPAIVGVIINVRCAVALLYHRMWGFVGLWAVGLSGFAFNLYVGMKFSQAVFGLFGLVILYWLLQIGGSKSGWASLK